VDDPFRRLVVLPFTIVVDSREQLPYEFTGMVGQGSESLVVPTVVQGLASGDYSIAGMEDQVAVERKSLDDLYGSVTWGRDRFEREIERRNKLAGDGTSDMATACGLAPTGFAAVVIEATWPEIMNPLGTEQRAMELAKEISSQAVSRFPETIAADIVAFAMDWAASKVFRPGWINQTDPKSVEGTIVSWSIRYPRVHWWACGDRRGGECRTFLILSKFWRERTGK
jgi:hypothetical protein